MHNDLKEREWDWERMKYEDDECIGGKLRNDGERARREEVGGVGEETAELSV